MIVNGDKILMQITHLKITYAIFFHHLQYSSYNTPNMKSKQNKINSLHPFHVIRLIKKLEG